jgi:ABC-type enterochelin transport system substrate-binding protein
MHRAIAVAQGRVAAVTVEHRFGSTTLSERPQRIVSLDSQ